MSTFGDIMMHLGDIMMHLGDTISTSGDIMSTSGFSIEIERIYQVAPPHAS